MLTIRFALTGIKLSNDIVVLQHHTQMVETILRFKSQ